MIGNGMRELDRFLSLLLDAIATLRVRDFAETVRFDTIRNTANKFDLLSLRLAWPLPDRPRLLALGRCRDCLLFTAGLVRRADVRGSASMTLGWPGARDHADAATSLPLGVTLRLTAADIASVCRFYEQVADDLVRRAAPQPARSAPVSEILTRK
jgi:hypothetical protein